MIEGRFPQDSTELIISLEFKERFDIATGDTLTLTAGKRMVRRTGAAAEVAGEDGNERMVPAGEYPAKGEEFRPEGERSFTVTGVFKNNSAFTPANPVFPFIVFDLCCLRIDYSCDCLCGGKHVWRESKFAFRICTGMRLYYFLKKVYFV